MLIAFVIFSIVVSAFFFTVATGGDILAAVVKTVLITHMIFGLLILLTYLQPFIEQHGMKLI